MKIVFAFDSFKGCLTAEEACHVAMRSALSVLPDAQIACVPLSDGGEGLAQCFLQTDWAKEICAEVHDPLMEQEEFFR
ncbi:MAG: glycerate kinase [Bacteroidales bacterium]|nr:glycerate kinase [Bacteroidales bacterium]